jgi:hypothetical protein
MNNLLGITPKQLRRAADLQERILKLQDELTGILGVPPETPAGAPAAPKNGRRKRRTMSAAGRAAVAAAQRARWAKIKGEKTPAKAEKKGRRKLSAAGRAAIAAAARARWAKAKAAGKKSL